MGTWEGVLKSTTRKSGDLPSKMGVSVQQLGLTEGDMTTNVIRTTTSVSTRIGAGLICLFLGATIVFTVGLSHMSVAHNAAHNTRHSIGFPCH